MEPTPQTSVQPSSQQAVKAPSRFFSYVKSKSSGAWKWIKAHKISAALLLIVVLGILGGIVRGATAPKVEYVTEKAIRTNLKQTVSATGKVDSDSAVDLKFGVAGEVEAISASVGDRVIKDQVIVSLKHDALSNQIREAEAALNLQKANYLKVASGAKREEILVSMRRVDSAEAAYKAALDDYKSLSAKLQADLISLQTQVKNATQALADAKTSASLSVNNARANLLTSINQSVIKSVNARNQVQAIYDDTELMPTFSATDFAAKNEARSSFDALGTYITIARQQHDAANLSLNDADIRTAAASAISMLSQVELMLKWMLQGLNATVTNSSTSQTEIDAYKTAVRAEQDYNNAQKIDLQSKSQLWETAIANQPISINTAQASLDSAIASFNAAAASNDVQLTKAQAGIDSAKTSLELAKAELALTQSRATSSDLAIAQAQIDQAQSVIDRLTTQLKDYQIIAPFDGVLGKVSVKENQSVTIADVIATIIGEEKFKISVDIPESDITKISLGNTVSVMLDAYSDDVLFTGHVTSIDTAETMIADVVYYKVEVALDDAEQVIKQGMSADLDILTNQKNGVVVVPARAVLDNPDGTKYVRVLRDGEVYEARVSVGIRGDEGKLEIVSGIAEGDLVITFEKKLQ